VLNFFSSQLLSIKQSWLLDFCYLDRLPLSCKATVMAESYLLEKLKSVEQTFHELTRRLADPEVATDPTEFQRVAKARSSLEETVITYENWKKAQEDLTGARQILRDAGGDAELREMATLEVEELESKLALLEDRLKILLLPRDPNDDKNIMLEIRAGTGGDEASIWAGDVLPLCGRAGLASQTAKRISGRHGRF
jgi:peptide chain release factor 1